MAGVYSCPSNRTNLEWHLQGPQIPNVTIVASVNEQGIKRTTHSTQEGPERARGWATTNHPAYQRDERQIDTGCFKTSAIDNRNRSGVVVARGFRVNLAPHSLPRSSLPLFHSSFPSCLPRITLSLSLFLSLLSTPTFHPFPIIILSLAFSRNVYDPRLARPLVTIASHIRTHADAFATPACSRSLSRSLIPVSRVTNREHSDT